MIPAITIRNLPQKITEPLLEDILNAHQVQSREIILQPQEPVATEPLQQAHVMLRKREAIPHALRILNQNEVGDQILQAIEATSGRWRGSGGSVNRSSHISFNITGIRTVRRK